MSSKQERFRVAVLDDYQNVALSLADWSALDARATVTVFNDHLADADALVERLQPFDIVCVMRERSPMTRSIIERLPKLRLIASTATRNASVDLKAAEERGVQVVHTGYTSAPTIELTWALILASARNLVAENASLRDGGWQQSVGDDMAGQTLGVLGLGNIGGAVAQIGNAFGMRVIAWSQNPRPSARLKWAPHAPRRMSCSKRRISSPSIWCSVEGREASSVRLNWRS